MADLGLPKIEEYSAAYWRLVAKEYGIRLTARATKAEVYAKVIARMIWHDAMLRKQGPRQA